jgi:hypothetical protein
MVLMRMADQDRCGLCSIKRRRKQSRCTVRRVEWPTRVQDDPVSGGMSNLDAASANLLRASMHLEDKAHE